MTLKVRRPKVTLVDASVYIHSILFGFIISEVFIISFTLTSIHSLSISKHFDQYEKTYQFIAFGILILVTSIYVWFRGGFTEAGKVLKSARFDLLVISLLGATLAWLLDPLFAIYYKKFYSLVPNQITGAACLIIFCSMFVIISDSLYREVRRSYNKQPPSFFMNDTELKSIEDDLLDHGKLASKFAEQLWNGGSEDSLVFGIDAPWGAGKSTFINFALEYLKSEKGSKIIVFRFNPLKLHDKTKYLEKIVDGLRHTISDEIFYPEFFNLLSTYSKKIGGKFAFSALGLKFDFSDSSIDAIFDELERALQRLNRKIVVVIDDLDRIDYTEVKEILFSIKKSFMLPNVSYLLSYDTENIIALDSKTDDPEKIREFLEKFVNIKISLFLDSQHLIDYLTRNFTKASAKNLLLDPEIITQTRRTIATIAEVFTGQDFYRYRTILADIRKLKRLINTMLSLEIQKTDFDITDFDASDLLHLLLIYLNYPNVFRILHDTETNGRSGFFSAVYERDLQSQQPLNQHSWRNSSRYKEYLITLDSQQRFLVEKVFSLPGRIMNKTDPDDKEAAILACFNSHGNNKNLERYLKLITSATQPVHVHQYNFYWNWLNKLLSGTTLSEVFTTAEFQSVHGEQSHEYLWRMIANGAQLLSIKKTTDVVNFLLANLPNYSVMKFGSQDTGLRNNLIILLLRIINQGGSQTIKEDQKNGTWFNNTHITQLIFGENHFSGRGVIDLLMDEGRGVLGLFDLLRFRQYCGPMRGADWSEVQHALRARAEVDDITEQGSPGSLNQVREISQKTVSLFISQYHHNKRNLLKEIDALTFDELAGKYHAHIKVRVEKSEITQEQLDQTIATTKSRLKMFICYQLGAVSTDTSVTCGYFDTTGRADQHQISELINSYLFEICFNPDLYSDAYELFIDYLLMSYPDPYLWNGANMTPTAQSLTSVLKKGRLVKYWIQHESSVKDREFQKQEKTIYTSNYNLRYSEHLTDIFALLDNMAATSDPSKIDS